jgi:hypothetical protein
MRTGQKLMTFKSNGPASVANRRNEIPRVLSRIIPVMFEVEHSDNTVK